MAMPLGFLMDENAGLGFVEAVKELAQMQGMPVPDGVTQPQDRERQGPKRKQTTLTDVMAQGTKHWKQHQGHPRAVAPVPQRPGLTGEIAARFGTGLCPENWRRLASVFPQIR